VCDNNKIGGKFFSNPSVALGVTMRDSDNAWQWIIFRNKISQGPDRKTLIPGLVISWRTYLV